MLRAEQLHAVRIRGSYARRLELTSGSRLGSLTAVAFLHLLLILALVSAFAVTVVKQQLAPSTPLIDIATTIAPPEQAKDVTPLPPSEVSGSGSDAPASLPWADRSRDAVAVSDSTPVPVAAPAPANATTAGSNGSASESGAGTGRGSGAGVNVGRGSGNPDGVSARARWLKGYISSEDYPRAALAAKAEGTVSASVTVGPRGAVSDCSISASSGHAELDSTVCRLITKRFRYEPARNAKGEAMTEVKRETFTWILPGND